MAMTNRRTLIAAAGLALARGHLELRNGHLELRNRRRADAAAPAAGPTGSGSPPGAAGTDPAASRARAVSVHFPTTDPADAFAVVGAAHTDIDAVAERVTARPHLARATVDWGFGDWESALGAASHMGRHDIAELLLEHGARPNIFSAAMMGQLAVVRALVEARPGVQRIPGPHGITLLAHARAGGEAAAPVYEYLAGLGDADMRPATVELTDEQRRAFLGIYEFDAARDATLEITDERGALWLRREGRSFGRRLFPVSGNAFYPSGSPTVRIELETSERGGATLRVVDAGLVLIATRRSG